jgi:hypothetical protein
MQSIGPLPSTHSSTAADHGMGVTVTVLVWQTFPVTPR